MIVKPETLTFSNKKIRILIAGVPGIGKTTLALSSPKPLYIDVDKSADRIDRVIFDMAAGVLVGKEYTNERGEKAHLPVAYEDIKSDLAIGGSEMEIIAAKNRFSHIETIVIDTGGKLLSLMGQHGAKINNKYRRTDGSLSQQGFGWLGIEFQRLLDHCIYELDKHIVIVFHTVEEKDGEDTKLRIKAVGSSKNYVWEVMDLGGFMEMRGNNRTIGFSNCERYFAKGTHGINGIRVIPELTPEMPNDFLTKLFAEYIAVSEAEGKQAAAAKEAYEAAMKEGRAIIDGISDADSANAAMASFKAISHALTSSKELSALWNEKIKTLGLFFDKVLGKYSVPEDKEES